jgi:hypothetical protein
MTNTLAHQTRCQVDVVHVDAGETSTICMRCCQCAAINLLMNNTRAHLAGCQVDVVHADAGEVVQSARNAVNALLSMR